MKKLAFVLALVLTLGVFGSMFAVGAAEPTRYDVEAVKRGFSDSTILPEGGISSNLATPGTNLQEIDLTGCSMLSNFPGVSVWILDIGEAKTINGIAFNDVQVTSGRNIGSMTYWYSVDGTNFTKLEEVAVTNAEDYIQYDPSRGEGNQRGYCLPMYATFADVEARYVMLAYDDQHQGYYSLCTGGEGNALYLYYDANVNSNTGDTLSIVALGTVAAVAGIVIVSKKKKNV